MKKIREICDFIKFNKCFCIGLFFILLGIVLLLYFGIMSRVSTQEFELLITKIDGIADGRWASIEKIVQENKIIMFRDNIKFYLLSLVSIIMGFFIFILDSKQNIENHQKTNLIFHNTTQSMVDENLTEVKKFINKKK